MVFYYLLLGHLIGDFTLQTNRIAVNKGSSLKWNLIHVVLVTLSLLLFCFPFGLQLMLLILGNGVAHFAIDHFKARLMARGKIPGTICFFADQMIHIGILYLISFASSGDINPFISFVAVKFLLAIVIITSFAAVMTQVILTAVFPRTGSKFFEEGEKQIGILTRVLLSMTFYMAYFWSGWYLLLLPIVGVLLLFKFKQSWKKWMQPAHLVSKILLDTFISLTGILLVFLR